MGNHHNRCIKSELQKEEESVANNAQVFNCASFAVNYSGLSNAISSSLYLDFSSCSCKEAKKAIDFACYCAEIEKVTIQCKLWLLYDIA